MSTSAEAIKKTRRFVVYEVWTRARVIEARDMVHAYSVGEPTPIPDMSLSNWHVVEIPEVNS